MKTKYDNKQTLIIIYTYRTAPSPMPVNIYGRHAMSMSVCPYEYIVLFSLLIYKFQTR